MRQQFIFKVVSKVNISIHAPIVGCDTSIDISLSTISKISIHAPIVGCDAECRKKRIIPDISIHAPIVGCDLASTVSTIQQTTISIHAPIVGCDEMYNIGKEQKQIFQSTHPSWGATVKLSDLKPLEKFQSTHPSWGATKQMRDWMRIAEDFNPRTHRGVRRLLF